MRPPQHGTQGWGSCAAGFLVAAMVLMGGCSSSNRGTSQDEFFDPVRVTQAGRDTTGNAAPELSTSGGAEAMLRHMLREQNRKLAELERRLATVETRQEVAAVETQQRSDLTPGEQALLAMIRQQNLRLEEIMDQVRLMAERRDVPARSQPNVVQRQSKTASGARMAYATAIATYQKGRFQEAERLFEKALQGSIEPSLADNCRFWIGVSRFQRKDFSGARAALDPVVRDRTSDKRMAAILMIGQVYEGLGRRDLARASYAQIVREQPNSSLRALAEQKIAKMRNVQ